MSTSPLDSLIYGAALTDEASARLFDDSAEIAAMLQVEAALAKVQGALGIIPVAAADRIADTARKIVIAPETLARGTRSDGIPVPALLQALRAALPEDIAPYVHWGATSQDIIDTALILRLRAACQLHADYLDQAMAALAQLAQQHRTTLIAARTRYQLATPTSFGLKAAGWLAPLLRQQQRLHELLPRLLVLQFGGAGGNLAALAGRGMEVAGALAAELDLGLPVMPWHSQRDAIAEYAGWLSLTSGALGKLGQDLLLLAQSEIAEVRLGEGGGSSTMPHKANPVAAELLVTLARFNAGQLGGMHQALLHAHERDGASWTAEWLTLPPMVVATGAALARAVELLQALEPDPAHMQRTLDDSHGLVFAEAAAFALAREGDLAGARGVVKAACERALREDRQLLEVLAAEAAGGVNWQAFVRDAAAQVGNAEQLIDCVLQQWVETRADGQPAGGS